MIVISTRRLRLRPASVSFEAIGSDAPRPWVKIWYWSLIPLEMWKSATACALSSESFCLPLAVPLNAVWPVIKRSLVKSLRISPIFSSFFFSCGRSLFESGSNWMFSRLIVSPLSLCFTEILSNLYFFTDFSSFFLVSSLFTDLYSVTWPFESPLKRNTLP